MANHSIKIRNHSDVFEEYNAGGTITPGMLLDYDSSGEVVAHATTDVKPTITMLALEDELQGGSISDDYSSGDVVFCWIPYVGDKFYGIVNIGETVAVGDLLYSTGDGYLSVITSGSEEPVAQALEAVAGGAGLTRVIARVI